MNAMAAYTDRICHRHVFSRLDGPSFQIHEARTCILPQKQQEACFMNLSSHPSKVIVWPALSQSM